MFYEFDNIMKLLDSLIHTSRPLAPCNNLPVVFGFNMILHNAYSSSDDGLCPYLILYLSVAVTFQLLF